MMTRMTTLTTTPTTMFGAWEDDGSALVPGTKAGFATGSVLGYCCLVMSAVGYCTPGSLVPSLFRDQFSGSVDISVGFVTSVVMSSMEGVVFRSIGRCCSTEVGSGTSRVCPALPGWRTPWVTWLDWSGFIVTSLKWDSVISSAVRLVSHDSATSGVVMTSFLVEKSPCDMSVVDVVIAAVKNSSVKFYKIRNFYLAYSNRCSI